MDSKVEGKVRAFFHKFPQRKFKDKEFMMIPSDHCESIFYTESGKVKQLLGTLRGEDIIIHIFLPGSYFPMTLALSDSKNEFYFQSVGETVVYEAEVKPVLDFVLKNTDVSHNLLRRFAIGLNKISLRYELILFQDAHYKILSLLVYLTKKFGISQKSKWTKIDINLTHYDIASWIGSQRETVSRHLEILAQAKVIKYRNRSFFVDMEKLIETEREYKYFLIRK